MIKPNVALAVMLLVLAPGPLAGALPEDVPVVYGSLEVDQSSVAAPADSDGMPELDQGAVPEGTQPESFTLDLGGGSPRPGDAPKINSFTIQTASAIQFASPLSPAQVNVTNPEGSTVVTMYQLRISAAELQRQIGRTGYTAAQWAEMNEQPDFDSEACYIELAATKGIAPGSMVQQMALGTLPDGTLLGAGDYKAEMVVLAYDIETNTKSMVNSVVKVGVHVLSEVADISFDELGQGTFTAYNPETQNGEIRYRIEISQQAIVDGCGSAHRTPQEQEAQHANPAFDPAYEFLTLYESQPVAPGELLDGQVQFARLPDGALLPAGSYTAWLTRYAYDDALGEWRLLDARTQLNLTVGTPAK